MAAQVTDYKCPACTGPLKYGKSGKMECEYCGSIYEVAEIEAMFEAENAKAVDAMKEKDAKVAAAQKEADAMGTDNPETWGVADGMKAYSCPSCGAELICDQTTAATCCPYCGNQTVIPGQFTGGFKPEFVIPFKTDKKEAKAALKKHYEGKKLLPNNFASGNRIEDIQGVYVPFWMFDTQVYGNLTYEAKKEHTTTTKDEEIKETEIYTVNRAGTVDFDKVPVDSSTKMPDRHMDAIEPYDYNELKPFSMAYMPGYLADKYDVETKDCEPRMQSRCRDSVRMAMDKTVTGYDSYNCKNEDYKYKVKGTHYALLPVWLLATKWEGQNFLFAMNGQTGKLVGDLPVDKGKYWKYVGTVLAVLLAIMNVINFVVLTTPATGFAYVLLDILLPVLIAFIYGGVLTGQMKSVFTASANKYVTDKGLKLDVNEDIYIRTDVSRRKINNSNNN